MPRNSLPRKDQKKVGGRNQGYGDMPPTSGINLVDQDVFDLLENRKVEHKPTTAPIRYSGPGASGRTPTKKYETEKFNATNMVLPK